MSRHPRSFRHSRSVAPILIALAAASVRGQEFTPLGVLPGMSDSKAYGISADGMVIVGSSGNRAFRWTAPGGMQQLSQFTSTAYATNADGSVVVGQTQGQPFRWTAGGAGGEPELIGPSGARALAVSADGNVVIGSTFPGAFRWTPGEGYRVLPLQQGMYGARATCVSGDGNTTFGYFEFVQTSYTRFVAIQWIGNSTATFTNGGRTLACTPDAQFWAGTTWTEGTGFYSRANRVTSTTELVLGLLPGDQSSVAYALSANGDVLVGDSAPSPTVPGRAFIYNVPTQGLSELKTYLVNKGVNLTGWTLTSARGISADGSAITGYAVGPSAATQAFQAKAKLCYANCDSSTTAPTLNINDFVCFQTLFAAGYGEANCDSSTIVPLLNVNDFICFQTRFAAGCQ